MKAAAGEKELFWRARWRALDLVSPSRERTAPTTPLLWTVQSIDYIGFVSFLRDSSSELVRCTTRSPRRANCPPRKDLRKRAF